MTRPIIHDPGSLQYETARALLVKELRAVGFRAYADRLEAGELYDIPPWIAMQVIARLV